MKKKLKILTIVGARPNFIKIAPLFEEFKKYRMIKPILVHTGQHYDFEMSQIFFRELKIPKPHYNLGVGSGSHTWQTAKIMERLELVILKEKPNLVIVVGDVNSTLAGALASAKLQIPIAHVESGLRSYDKTMPEEVNRVLTDHISDFLFCPTKTAVKNLEKEGITKGVYNVGDIMYDAFLKNIWIAQKKSKILNKLNSKPKSYILLTVHRPSNTDNLKNLKNILEAIQESDERIIFPLHPRTKKQLKKLNYLCAYQLTNLQLIEPAGYVDMLWLEKNAKKILSDSGGVQKEAYCLKIPCITLRDKTEWVETIKEKWNVLVGANKEKILSAIKNFNPMFPQKKHFGDGKTSKKILKILVENSIK